MFFQLWAMCCQRCGFDPSEAGYARHGCTFSVEQCKSRGPYEYRRLQKKREGRLAPLYMEGEGFWRGETLPENLHRTLVLVASLCREGALRACGRIWAVAVIEDA